VLLGRRPTSGPPALATGPFTLSPSLSRQHARSADRGSMRSPRGRRSPSPAYGWRPCGPRVLRARLHPHHLLTPFPPRLILSRLGHARLASASNSGSSAATPSPRQPDLATAAPPSNPARTRLPHPLTDLTEPFEAHLGKVSGRIGHLPPRQRARHRGSRR
jgi:hypothetical protein